MKNFFNKIKNYVSSKRQPKILQVEVPTTCSSLADKGKLITETIKHLEQHIKII